MTDDELRSYWEEDELIPISECPRCYVCDGRGLWLPFREPCIICDGHGRMPWAWQARVK